MLLALPWRPKNIFAHLKPRMDLLKCCNLPYAVDSRQVDDGFSSPAGACDMSGIVIACIFPASLHL